ncbi:pyrroline-5-carboxylate reductase [Hathewaya proteolytica DSM 3090]|uniref:Pyrroline-5-carboxylate reductase n=1 Tax=Hathewaya proteolytica DSM 3090 TaxID=1121331 RepID=A0A1M6PH47_9CLOT|nr:pyrroline-5-carboxylate reductase [Hathewaya proteolytica]SHK07217.1 pyrroline-5-carboxylate reductase [Hathewaya proteolytica DSM 3090]
MKIGFIGCGNMGRAMMGGIIQAGLVEAENVYVADLFVPSLERAKEDYGVNTTTKNIEVAEQVDVLILSVKPNILNAVAKEVKDVLKKDVMVISIIAGKTVKQLEECFGSDVKIIRSMPNTPALVGEGMSAICPNKKVNEEELELAKNIFQSFGKVEVLPESLVNAFVSISGSSPAYIYMLIEAMADAAVYDGIPRDKAYNIAAQAVLGSAKMVLETGKHPGQLKDMVCSPGGTTIAAVSVLEEERFRYSIIKAMRACTEKCNELGNN